MGTKRNTRRILVAGIMVAGLTGGAMAVRADTFSQRSSSGQSQDLSHVAPPTWPSVAPTCTSSPCSITLHAKADAVLVKDVNGDQTVPYWGFGVSTATLNTSGTVGLAGSPTSIIKVPQGTVLNITVDQAVDSLSPIDLTFPSLPHGDVVKNSVTSYTVTASQVGTSVFQPGVNPTADPTVKLDATDAPRQIAMGLVGVLIVTPSMPTSCYASAYDPTTQYADEAVVATTTLDAEFAAAVTANIAFDMSYFGQSRDSSDQPRKVYHLINGHAFPDTQVIDAKAGDQLLLRYVNASVTDKSLGLLGLREVLLGRNADAYKDPQTFIAPLIGPGETADVAVNIPADAAAGQKYSLIDQGRQMNHGDAAGFGGALTFIVVWKGAPVGPTVSALHYDPVTGAFTGTATPSAPAFPVTKVEYSLCSANGPWTLATGTTTFSSTTSVALTGASTLYVQATGSNGLVGTGNLAVAPLPPTLSGLSYDLAGGHLTGTAAPSSTLYPLTKVEYSLDNFKTVAGTNTTTPQVIDFNVGLTAPGTISVRVTDSIGQTGTGTVAVTPAAPVASSLAVVGGNITATGTATPGLTITAAEYFVGATDPGLGLAAKMTGTIPGNPVTNLTATPATPFKSGDVISVRVQDSFGQWSAIAMVTA